MIDKNLPLLVTLNHFEAVSVTMKRKQEMSKTKCYDFTKIFEDPICKQISENSNGCEPN